MSRDYEIVFALADKLQATIGGEDTGITLAAIGAVVASITGATSMSLDEAIERIRYAASSVAFASSKPS